MVAEGAVYVYSLGGNVLTAYQVVRNSVRIVLVLFRPPLVPARPFLLSQLLLPSITRLQVLLSPTLPIVIGLICRLRFLLVQRMTISSLGPIHVLAAILTATKSWIRYPRLFPVIYVELSRWPSLYNSHQ